jgi:hypothetical protein
MRGGAKFVTNGGALIATGVTSVYNEFGDARSDYGPGRPFRSSWHGTHRRREGRDGPDAAFVPSWRPVPALGGAQF